MNPIEETGKTARSFFDVMRNDPLALSLVVSNFLLLGFLFYSNAEYISTRRQTAELIVGWQERTDKLLASCVSADIMRLVLNALERDRQAMRKWAEPEPPKSLEPRP